MKHIVTITIIITAVGCTQPLCEPVENQECVCPAELHGANIDSSDAEAPVLPRSVIKETIRSHVSEIRTCYDEQLAQSPELEGKVVVNFTIAETGEVTDASIKSSTMNSEDVEGCMLAEAKTWTFPEPSGGGTVEVSYPFIFKNQS